MNLGEKIKVNYIAQSQETLRSGGHGARLGYKNN